MPFSLPRHPGSGLCAFFLSALPLAAMLVLSGCAQTAAIGPSGGSIISKDGKGKQVSTQFSDLPVPKGAKINVDKTVVVGTKNWFGQLTLDTSHGADVMFNFYSRELPNYGWRRIASIRAPTSILTYDHQNRVLYIAIQPSRIRGSEITITVSPKEYPSPVPLAPPPTPLPGAVLPAPPAGIPLAPPPQPRRN